MRHRRTEIKAGGEDLVGVGRDHVDAAELLSGVNEDAEHHAAEGLGLAILEEFFVLEWCFGLLGFIRSDDAVQFTREVRVVLW